MLTLIPYGLKDGQLIRIEDVISGLACNCTCPSCGESLVARKGDLRTHHFAHHVEGNCVGAIETALHLAAKAILVNNKKILLPELDDYLPAPIHEHVVYQKSSHVKFDEVKSEVYLEDIVPDIIGYLKGQPILIEIAVTHFVDDVKRMKIEQRGISCIEIDLGVLQDGFTEQELKNAVLRDPHNREWIFHRKLKSLREKYIETQNRTILENQKKEERRLQLRSELENKKRTLKRAGFQIIEADEEGKRLCPKLIKENAFDFRSNEITLALRNGASWNGTIYGLNNNDRYIFLDGEKKVIIPYSLAEDLSGYLFEDFKNTFGQLNRIARRSDVELETCRNCEHLHSILDPNRELVSCRFRKSLRSS